MSDLPQQETIIQYLADGVTTDYIIPFYTPLDNEIPSLDIYVTLDGATPIPEDDIKVFDVDYTYSSNLDPITGGILEFLSGKTPPLNSTVTAVRNVPAALNVEFVNAQNFSGANLDAALQTLLIITQQNKTYALERNLSYIVNSYLPDSTRSANTQIPVLAPNQIWQGSPGGVVAVDLEENPDVSTLRAELALETPSTNGASIVGYYNPVDLLPTTVKAALDNIFQNFSLIPPGFIGDFGGVTVPDGWLACDGSAVSRTTYADLFDAIGVTWGAGDSSTTFNVPDFRRRTAVGSGGSGTGTLGNSVGNSGGSETHTMTLGELVAHTHVSSIPTYTSNASGAKVATSNGSFSANQDVESQSTGSTTAFNIVQPSNIVLKMIKY